VSGKRRSVRFPSRSFERLNPAAPIGVFDSGVGGLSVLLASRAELPRENFVYFADSAFAPYGDKSDAYIIERSERIGAWFVAQGAKAIVVACNTATAIAVQTLRANVDLPIVGVEPGLKPALTMTRTAKVGVLATAATLASKRYADLLARVQRDAPGVEFIGQVGSGWVELVERGELTSTQTQQTIINVIAPLVERGCDTLVLGCTHYAFLAPLIHAAAPSATIVDTAPAIARELARRINESRATHHSMPDRSLRFVTTGNVTQSERVVRAMLADTFNVESVQSVSV
jgi:glutamate racemase